MKILYKHKDSDYERAIVRYNILERRKYKVDKYGCLWREIGEKDWNDFGGSVGYTIADFKTLQEAKDFIVKGLAEQDENPDIWLEMVEA